MADRVAAELDRWSGRTAYSGADELVFAHPQTGGPLDRSKVPKRFKSACRSAAVRPVRFHDLRHTFVTRMAAAGRALANHPGVARPRGQQTTQIYAHYAPSEREVELVNNAFASTALEPRVQIGVQIERN
jgi:integrase